MIYLGIDLGTTYSLAAYVNSHGVPTLFPDYHDANSFRTPSVVHIGEEGCLIGDAVEELLEDEPDLRHARFVKLAMGSDEPAFTDHRERIWRPESISALILRKLVQDVQAFSAEPIGGAVITVPANFDDAQRQATRHAALMAGLPSPVLVDEPVAAATYYGFSEKSGEQTLFVYDLGGGTFDATLLQAAEQGLYALATEGTNAIGGRNIDDAIIEQVAEEFERVHGTDPRQDAASRERLRRFATRAKLKLTKPGARQERKTLLLAGNTIDYVITRQHLEDLIRDLIDETLAVSGKCLEQAGIGWDMVDRILLTGGSSLLPMVNDRIAEASGLPTGRIVCRQPHQAVAYGAALIARQQFGNDSDRALSQVSSYDLGVRVLDSKTGKPAVKTLVERNSPIPAEEQVTFYTNRPDQQRIIVEVVQQRETDADEKSLGYFAFGPISNPHKNYPIEITVAYDAEGMVRVTARDVETGDRMERILSEEGEALSDELAKQQEWAGELLINA